MHKNDTGILKGVLFSYKNLTGPMSQNYGTARGCDPRKQSAAGRRFL